MAPARRHEDRSADSRRLLAQGIAESHRGEFKSIQTLAAALSRFQTEQDREGAVLAATMLLNAANSFSNFRRLAEFVEVASTLRDGTLRFGDPSEELLAQAGWLVGLIMVRPDDAAIAPCVKRIMALLELDLEVNARFAAGRLVLYYADAHEARELGQHVYALVQPSIDDPALTPYRLGRWLVQWARCASDGKDEVQAERARAQVLDLVARHRDKDTTFFVALGEFDGAVHARDFERMGAAVAMASEVADPTNLNDLGRVEWFKGRLALAQGDADAALFHARRSRKFCEELETPGPMLAVRIALEGQAAVAARDFSGARAAFRRAAELAAVLHKDEMHDMIRMVDAYEALVLGRPQGRALLAQAFAAPRLRQYYDSFETNAMFGATMCALALEHDVETEFVRRIIQVNRLAPPPDAGAGWPWAVKITTLGGFALARAGKPMVVQGKAQKKPLELLKVLVAAGGRGVDKSRLADTLWPDADAAAAIAALDMAISRLRKLLDIPQAVRIEDGKVDLDPALVWVDVLAFDRDVEALQAALNDAGTPGDAVAALGRRILDRYPGAFLANEEVQRVLLSARDRWHHRFLRSVADAGRYLERVERWSDAATMYVRGIDADTLAEDLYRRLMRCHLAEGQPTEAVRVYRRCREMLSVQLGIPPSAETEALFQSIYRP